jgi:hypothetical protein
MAFGGPKAYKSATLPLQEAVDRLAQVSAGHAGSKSPNARRRD